MCVLHILSSPYIVLQSPDERLRSSRAHISADNPAPDSVTIRCLFLRKMTDRYYQIPERSILTVPEAPHRRPYPDILVS